MTILTLNNLPSPKKPLPEAAKIAPKEPGCYRIFFKGDLIYVGKAVNLRKRLSEYVNGSAGKYPSSEFISEYSTEIEVIYVPIPREDLKRREQELMKLFHPLLNKRNSTWLRGKK